MKHVYPFLLVLLVLVFSSSSILKNGSGIAGLTGSPGEGTCTQCHSGGSAASSGITLTAVPAFTNNEYMMDSLYKVSISVSAAGFGRFGFGCEILNENDLNAGTMQSPGPGVKFLNAFNGRRNAVHSTPKIATVATFTFQWKAPSSGSVTVYAMANAVNGNNSFTGDFPLSPFSLSLTPWTLPIDTSKKDTSTVGLRNIARFVSRSHVSPNPVKDIVQVEYVVEKSGPVIVSLCAIDGRVTKTLSSGWRSTGRQSEILRVPDLPPGAYFIEISAGNGEATRCLVILQ